MRTLTLIRHAKSSWTDIGLADMKRPLAPRGLAAGQLIARWLGAHLARPDVVLCSSAERTRATWAMLSGSWAPIMPTVTFDDALYMIGSDALLRRIGQTPAAAEHLMIIGHNPGLHDLAAALVGRAHEPDRLALAVKFPTAGVAVLEFDAASWSALQRGDGTLQHFVSPRRLAGVAGP